MNSVNPEYNTYLCELKLFHDNFMTKVFEDEECLNLVLSIILKRNIETKRSVVKRFIQNLKGRSLQLDIFAMDEFLTCYNLEVQNKADTGILKKKSISFFTNRCINVSSRR
jgi:hypothetical protein